MSDETRRTCWRSTPCYAATVQPRIARPCRHSRPAWSGDRLIRLRAILIGEDLIDLDTLRIYFLVD